MTKTVLVRCDVKDCDAEATPVELTLLNVEIVPTGNSDYSAYEEKSLKAATVDLCKLHRELYEMRVPLVRDRSGLRMRTPIGSNLEETSE